jgi:uncharacterized RDD family membrane protein YckC
VSTVILTASTNLAQRRALARVHPATAPPIDEADIYAGIVTRSLAFAMDALIINAVALITGVVVGLCLSILHLPSELITVLAAIGGAVWVLWTVAYFTFFWSSTGQTPGNRVMRIRVVDGRGGDPLKPRRALLRFAGLVVAAIPLLAGIWIMLWDRRRRCLQDRVARTLVVYEPDEDPQLPTARLLSVPDSGRET